MSKRTRRTAKKQRDLEVEQTSVQFLLAAVGGRVAGTIVRDAIDGYRAEDAARQMRMHAEVLKRIERLERRLTAPAYSVTSGPEVTFTKVSGDA